MKYLVVEDGDVYDDYGDAINACIDDDWHWDDDDDFENWVNDCYGDIEICGTRYYAYDILYNMGEDDLRDLRRDYCRDQNERDEDDARYCLEDADIGYTYELHGRTIEVIADEEEEEEETGDTDGDEEIQEYKPAETVETLRVRLLKDKEEQETKKAEEHKADKDLMSMFQIVGG